MCGIAGVLDVTSSREQLERNAVMMADSLAYRGPDDHGLWSDHEAGVALTHRRLSIVDLSPAGHQPMVSADGRFVITYNGEIYNFQELRPELEARGVKFRGHSDTEIMLEAFAAYGVEATVKRLIGMFTIGVWDRRRAHAERWCATGLASNLCIGRNSVIFFYSDPSLRRCGSIRAGRHVSIVRLSHRLHAAQLHSRHRTRSTKVSTSFEPGTILSVSLNGEPRIERFWDARAVAKAGLANPLQPTTPN